MACATIMFDEVYPLWTATANYLGESANLSVRFYCLNHNFHNTLGGLQFSVYEIGLSLIVVGVFMVPFNLLLYPLVS